LGLFILIEWKYTSKVFSVIIPRAITFDLYAPIFWDRWNGWFWECSEVVPRGAGGIDDVVHVVEDGVGQPVGAEELPDIFDRIESRSAGRGLKTVSWRPDEVNCSWARDG